MHQACKILDIRSIQWRDFGNLLICYFLYYLMTQQTRQVQKKSVAHLTRLRFVFVYCDAKDEYTHCEKCMQNRLFEKWRLEMTTSWRNDHFLKKWRLEMSTYCRNDDLKMTTLFKIKSGHFFSKSTFIQQVVISSVNRYFFSKYAFRCGHYYSKSSFLQ